MSGPLRVEHPAPGVAVLTLALPERRNAMTAELTAAWGEAIPALAADPRVRAVVVTGEGSAFCSGGDLSWIEAGGADGNTPDALRARMYPFYRTWLAIRDLPVPTIAAVNGPAIGAGLCLALACDLRHAAPAARFAAPFTTLGMHPGMAATYLLPEVVGLARARELLFTGRTVDAAEAAAIGLVSSVLPAESLRDTVVATAARIAAAAPIATRLTKAALRDGPRGYEQALEWEALAQPVTLASEDLREGLRAQAERRRPVFRGR
ncbi:MAG TPA: enoyl-CoA hydratase-related protein [Frankiaceae bacterium]|nr:enoyl-CoA hydratase-related protein [Frankiaceae bacterium]